MRTQKLNKKKFLDSINSDKYISKKNTLVLKIKQQLILLF